MMYHWVISGLACNATVVLTDGAAIPRSSDGLDVGLLWRVAAEAGVTHFGISPKYLLTVAEAGYRPADRVDLSRLRVGAERRGAGGSGSVRLALRGGQSAT